MLAQIADLRLCALMSLRTYVCALMSLRTYVCALTSCALLSAPLCRRSLNVGGALVANGQPTVE